MTRRIQISAGDVTVTASLNDSATAEAIWQALPLEGSADLWGDEIYFAIPLMLDQADDARQEMQIGELGYWPDGYAFCIFFGPTPVSEGKQPRAFSNVNPFGAIEGKAKVLKSVQSGEIVRIERLEE